MQLQVDDSSTIVDIETAFPRYAPVRGFEQSSFFIASVQTSKSTHINRVRVCRVDHHFADLKRLFQSHVFPGLATVGRLVNPVTVADRVSRIVFSSANPNDFRIALGHRHRSDRYRGFLVKLMLKGNSIVGGFD